MAKPGSDRDGAMVDKQAGKKVCEPSQGKAGRVRVCVCVRACVCVCVALLLFCLLGESRSSLYNI